MWPSTVTRSSTCTRASTVVRGLGPDARQRLVDAFIGLPDGITRGVTGWVELDGARRDLGAAVFEGLAVPEDTKLVVRGG